MKSSESLYDQVEERLTELCIRYLSKKNAQINVHCELGPGGFYLQCRINHGDGPQLIATSKGVESFEKSLEKLASRLRQQLTRLKWKRGSKSQSRVASKRMNEQFMQSAPQSDVNDESIDAESILQYESLFSDLRKVG